MKIKINQAFYLFFIFFITLDSSINVTRLYLVFGNIHSWLLILALTNAVFCAFTKTYTFKKLYIVAVAFLLGLLTYYISGNTDFLFTILAVVLIDSAEIDNVIKTIFFTKITVLICTVTLSLVGILEKGNIASTSSEKSVLFGYGHANTFAGTVGIILLLFFALNRHRLKRIHLLFAFLLELFCFYYSRTRTGLLLISLSIILLLFNDRDKIKKKFFSVSTYFFPCLLSLNFILIFLRRIISSSTIMDKIDSLFNGRLFLATLNLEYYPVKLLGQRVDLGIIAEHNSYYALDNGYTYILIYYGIFGLILFGFFFHTALINCIKNNEYVLYVVCIITMIWCVYEGMVVSAPTNFAILFALCSMKESQCRRKIKIE